MQWALGGTEKDSRRRSICTTSVRYVKVGGTAVAHHALSMVENEGRALGQPKMTPFAWRKSSRCAGENNASGLGQPRSGRPGCLRNKSLGGSNIGAERKEAYENWGCPAGSGIERRNSRTRTWTLEQAGSRAVQVGRQMRNSFANAIEEMPVKRELCGTGEAGSYRGAQRHGG